MSTRIYTRTGDEGETGLFRGGRVAKDNVRVETYGTVDELNAALGLVLAQEPQAQIARPLQQIQSLLFELGAELATPPGEVAPPGRVNAADVKLLERAIDEAESKLPPLATFILPSGTPVAAGLHLARAICRRAERQVVTLRRTEPSTSKTPLVFLNRLSDLLFVLARLANHIAGAGDVAWSARTK